MKKTRECIRCVKFFDCMGKDGDGPCLCFQERKEKNDGKQKNVHNENMRQ